MTDEALKLWQAVPSDIRRMLLSNVWCGECRKSVTIVDYHAELNGVVVLQGSAVPAVIRWPGSSMIWLRLQRRKLRRPSPVFIFLMSGYTVMSIARRIKGLSVKSRLPQPKRFITLPRSSRRPLILSLTIALDFMTL